LLVQNACELAVKADLDLLRVFLKSFVNLRQWAFPAAAFVCSKCLACDGKNVFEEIAILLRFALNNVWMVRVNPDNLLYSWLRLDLGDTAESVTHDANQHIQEGDLDYEGREDEEHPWQGV